MVVGVMEVIGIKRLGENVFLSDSTRPPKLKLDGDLNVCDVLTVESIQTGHASFTQLLDSEDRDSLDQVDDMVFATQGFAKTQAGIKKILLAW